MTKWKILRESYEKLSPSILSTFTHARSSTRFLAVTRFYDSQTIAAMRNTLYSVCKQFQIYSPEAG
eukprot:4873774-Pyramimonas_sp.AAC.1